MRKDSLLAVTLFATGSIGTGSSFVVVTAGGGLSQTTRLLLPSVGPGGGDLRATNPVRSQRKNGLHRLEAKKAKAGKEGRPSLDDVERLSRGQAAKKRGTGSRGVCHRLNESERKAYDLAKKQGYVVLRGTGYRRERKGSPLLNIYRQFCDAKAMACTCVLTGLGADAVDEVEIDFSPLRTTREAMDSLGERADEVAAELEALPVEPEEMAVVGSLAGVAGSGQDAADGASGVGGEGELLIEEEEEEEEEWTGDPKNRPIWKFPVVSRVYRCESRKRAKDVAEALSSMR